MAYRLHVLAITLKSFFLIITSYALRSKSIKGQLYI
jgi:hypothetical protein